MEFTDRRGASPAEQMGMSHGMTETRLLHLAQGSVPLRSATSQDIHARPTGHTDIRSALKLQAVNDEWGGGPLVAEGLLER